MNRILLITALALSLQGCAGLIIGAATDATIAVAKVPFKVGAAVIDVVSGDDEDE
ncbi:MAG: NF038104 family lipoprotein [Thiolinea sp.]